MTIDCINTCEKSLCSQYLLYRMTHNTVQCVEFLETIIGFVKNNYLWAIAPSVAHHFSQKLATVKDMISFLFWVVI